MLEMTRGLLFQDIVQFILCRFGSVRSIQTPDAIGLLKPPNCAKSVGKTNNGKCQRRIQKMNNTSPIESNERPKIEVMLSADYQRTVAILTS